MTKLLRRKLAVWLGIGLFTIMSFGILICWNSPNNFAGFKNVALGPRQLSSEAASANQTREQVENVIEHAAQSERAIVFVHMDWSATSLFALIKFDEYVSAYLDQPDVPFVNFHVINYTDFTSSREGDPLSRIPNRENPGHKPLIAGGGELIYMENGEIRACEPAIAKNRFQIEPAVAWTNRLVAGTQAD